MRPPFRFPEDLITLQQAWQQTYAALAQAPAGTGTTALRRRLIVLSGRLCTHPYWTAPTGRRAGAADLRLAARAPSGPGPDGGASHEPPPVGAAAPRPTPDSTGACVGCRQATTRYGAGADALCTPCQRARAERLART